MYSQICKIRDGAYLYTLGQTSRLKLAFVFKKKEISEFTEGEAKKDANILKENYIIFFKNKIKLNYKNNKTKV